MLVDHCSWSATNSTSSDLLLTVHGNTQSILHLDRTSESLCKHRNTPDRAHPKPKPLPPQQCKNRQIPLSHALPIRVSEISRPGRGTRPITTQGLLNIDLRSRLLVQELERLRRLSTTRPLQSQKGKVAAHNRPRHEVEAGIASVAFGVVEICKWPVCIHGQLSTPPKSTREPILPVDVSFTHFAMVPRISVLVFLLVTAAAKNSQSLLV